jgi:RHS repeat-associated protein
MIWDGDELLAQVDTSGTLIEFWSRAEQPLPDGKWSRLVKARLPGNANPDQYLHSDWQGTVLATSGATGAGLLQEPPPRLWGPDGPPLAPLSWLGNHGYWYEGQLARPMHYVRARWYPDVGTGNGGGTGWLSPDPMGFDGGDWNLYRYVMNRPTVFVDPQGESPRNPWWRIRPHNLPPRGIFGPPGPTFRYGQYCGADVVKNPGWHVLPQDCLDACCMDHDRCLEGHYGAGYTEKQGHRCCDAILHDCVQDLPNSGCCDNSPLGSIICLTAAHTVLAGMVFTMYLWPPFWGPTTRPCLPVNKWPPNWRLFWGNPWCITASGVRRRKPAPRKPIPSAPPRPSPLPRPGAS